MKSFDSYQLSRLQQTPETIVRGLVFGLILVVTTIVVAFIMAANAGSLESRAAAATPTTESAGVPSPTCVDVVPATATVGLASGNDRNSTPTFGYLIFEREFTDGSTATGFGPLPATACIPTEPSTTEGDNPVKSADGTR